ncbi:MAG: hypothetical protein KJ630_05045 [Proteobacteria bacterium]|nr:hypothetical protein [Pseudomonadota bacterium]
MQKAGDFRYRPGNLDLHRQKHTVGGYAKWHPHVHAIRPLAEFFRAAVLKMLKEAGRLDDTLIKKILAWRYNSGFSYRWLVRPLTRVNCKKLPNRVAGGFFSPSSG